MPNETITVEEMLARNIWPFYGDWDTAVRVYWDEPVRCDSPEADNPVATLKFVSHADMTPLQKAAARTAQYLRREWQELGQFPQARGFPRVDVDLQCAYHHWLGEKYENTVAAGFGTTRCKVCGVVIANGHLPGCDLSLLYYATPQCIGRNLPGVFVDVADPDTLRFPNHVGVEPAGAGEAHRLRNRCGFPEGCLRIETGEHHETGEKWLTYYFDDALPLTLTAQDLIRMPTPATRNNLELVRRQQNDAMRAERRQSDLDALVRMGLVDEEQAVRLRNSPGFAG